MRSTLALPLAAAIITSLYAIRIRHHEFLTEVASQPSYFPRPRRPQCAQLWDAHHHVLMHESDRVPSVTMVQLVGVWKDNEQAAQVMNDVFMHNKQLLQRHGIPSLAIEQRPGVVSDEYAASPAFWKMNVTLHQCKTSDLVVFLDGDVIIRDPSARLDALWVYLKDRSDMIFAGDGSGINSGIFIVNCESSFAISMLQAWDMVARDIYEKGLVYSNAWYEQNALHFMLQTDYWKKKTLPESTKPLPKWDEASYQLPSNLFSTKELRKRILVTDQCTLNTYPLTRPRRHKLGSHDRKAAAIYAPGHFMLHGAALNTNAKLRLLEPLLLQEPAPEGSLTLHQAARLYLEAHAMEYNYTDPELVNHK